MARRRRRNVRKVVKRRSSNKSSFTGVVLKLPPIIPAFTNIPWSPLTISDKPTISGEKSYTFADLWRIIVAQTGVSTSGKPQASISLRTVRVYSSNTGDSFTIGVYDLFATTKNDFLYQGQAQPSPMSFSKIGYQWPRSQWGQVIDSDSAQQCVWIGTTKPTILTVLFTLNWKPHLTSRPNLSEIQRDFELL